MMTLLMTLRMTLDYIPDNTAYLCSVTVNESHGIHPVQPNTRQLGLVTLGQDLPVPNFLPVCLNLRSVLLLQHPQLLVQFVFLQLGKPIKEAGVSLKKTCTRGNKNTSTRFLQTCALLVHLPGPPHGKSSTDPLQLKSASCVFSPRLLQVRGRGAGNIQSKHSCTVSSKWQTTPFFTGQNKFLMSRLKHLKLFFLV